MRERYTQPYHLVNDWAHMPRPWAPTNNVYVDAEDPVWVFDRCEDKGCAGSSVARISELSADGQMMKNFGAGMFVFPHQVLPGSNCPRGWPASGSVWVVDGRAADGKGMQVMKLSPYGKGLMALGKAGQGGKALTCSISPHRWRSHATAMPSSPKAMHRLWQFTHQEVRQEWKVHHDFRPCRVG